MPAAAVTALSAGRHGTNVNPVAALKAAYFLSCLGNKPDAVSARIKGSLEPPALYRLHSDVSKDDSSILSLTHEGVTAAA